MMKKFNALFFRSVAVSVFAVGGMAGGLLSGWLADKVIITFNHVNEKTQHFQVGRKGGLLYNNIFAFIAAALMGLAKSVGAYPLIILGRLFIGFNCGIFTHFSIVLF